MPATASTSATANAVGTTPTPTLGARPRAATVGQDVRAARPERAVDQRSRRHHVDETRRTRRHPRRGACGGTCLFDPSGSVVDRPGVHRLRWSPLPSCTSWRTALTTARSLVLVGAAGTGPIRGESSHWTERAQALLAPLLHAAALEGADMRTVLAWVDRRQALPAQQALAAGTGGDTGIARDVLDGIVTTDERELSGIWSTASGALEGSGPSRRWPPPRSRLRPRSFVPSGDTVYVAAPAHRQALVAPLVVGLIDDVRRATYARRRRRWRAATGPPVRAGPRRAGQHRPPARLPSMVSEGGGQGLVTLACFQDLSQARHRWPGQADGFPSLFGTTVVLPGIGDVRTLEALSTLAGDEEIPTRTVSAGRMSTDHLLADLVAGGRLQRGESVSTQWRRVLPPDVIARGAVGHALAFDERNRPAWVPLAPFYAREPWRALWGAGRSVERGVGRRVGGSTGPGVGDEVGERQLRQTPDMGRGGPGMGR